MEEHDWQRQMRQDPRTTPELVSLALTAMDDESAWQPVQILHYRANREVLETARVLSGSGCPRERELAANILGQLGVAERVFPEESVGLLIHMLEREAEPEVLSAIAVALGHQGSSRAAVPLARLRQHADPDVRWSVAYGLAGLNDEAAVQALIELTSDTDDDVRDWATFALGSQIELDTPAVRDALAQRLDDPHEDTQGEALIGLAQRRDDRVFEPLLRELQSDQVRVYAVEAAGLIGDPRLYPALLLLWKEGDEGYFETALVGALARCKPHKE